MEDNTEELKILRQGVNIQYEPPKALVESGKDKDQEATKKEEAAAIVLAKDLRKSYEDLVVEVDDTITSLKGDLVSLPVNISNLHLASVLTSSGYSPKVTIHSLQVIMQDPKMSTVSPHIFNSFFDGVLDRSGNNAPIIFFDLINLRQDVVSILQEMLSSEFYGLWIDTNFESYIYPNGTVETGKAPYFDSMIYYYSKKAQLQRTKLGKIKEYLNIPLYNLEKCLWEKLLRGVVSTKDMNKLLQEIQSLVSLLRKLLTIAEIGYVLDNDFIKSFISKLQARILEQLAFSLEQALTQVAFNVASGITSDVLSFTKKWQDDLGCPIFMELNSVIYSILSEEVLSLNGILTKRLGKDEQEHKDLTKKYNKLAKKKRLKNIINTLQSIISVLQTLVQNNMHLSDQWFDDLFLKAQKDSKAKNKQENELIVSPDVSSSFLGIV